MQFIYKPGQVTIGETLYRDDEHSLDFLAHDSTASIDELHASLVIGATLQIEFRINDGRLLHIWGYSPKQSWRVSAGKIDLTHAIDGEVCVEFKEPEAEPLQGVAYKTELSDEPVVYYEKQGLLGVGDISSSEQIIRIASDTLVGLNSGRICFAGVTAFSKLQK